MYVGSADNTAPNPPTNPTASNSNAGSGNLTISWTAASGGEDGGGYLVVRGTSDPSTAPNVNGIYSVNNTITTGQTVVYIGNGTSFNDSGLTNDTPYFYRIYTFDKAYNYSSGVSATAAPFDNTIPSITAATFNGTFGQAFSANITAANSPTSFGNSTALPPGLTLNSTTGAITGTPIQAGTFNATLSASNGNGTRSAAFTFNIAKGTPTIATLPIASAINDGQALSSSTLSGGNVTGIGGAPLPGNFTFTNPGLTPSTTGNQSILFTPTDTVNWETLTRNVSVTVNIVPRIFVSPTSLSGFSTKQNAASANQTLTVNATNVSGGVTVTAPTGYEISTNGTTFSNSLTLSPTTSNTTVIASDNAGNYGGNWTNGSNGGSGFGPWIIRNQGDASTVIANPSTAQITGMNANSFRLGGTTNYSDADRVFLAPLGIGGNFSIQWGNNWDSGASGAKGINIYTGGLSGSQIININMAGSQAITINGQPMFNNYGTLPITLNFEYVAAGSLRIYGTGRDGTESFNRTFTVSGAPDAFRLYAGGLATDVTNRYAFANNLQITTPVGNLTNTTLFVRLATNGTPGAANGNLTFTSTNATTQTVALSGNVDPLRPPVVAAQQTFNGTVGQSFSANISATNSPTSFGNSTALPAGLTLNSTTGEITGTPTAAGNFTIAVAATNVDGTGTGNLTFVIGRGTPTITTPPTASRIFTDQTLASSTLTGGNATGIGSAALPGNFTFTTPTTNFPDEGNPTASITFSPADSGNWTTTTGNVTVPVAVRMPPVITSQTINGTVGRFVSANISATNMVGIEFAPTSYGNSTALPSWLTLDSTTGAITGNATTADTFTVVVTATSSHGTGTGNLTFVIERGKPVIDTLPTADAIFEGQSLGNSTLRGGSASGLPGIFTFTDLSETFPSPGNYTANITFTPTDLTNWNTASGNVIITVSPKLKPVITSKTINGTVDISLDEVLDTQNPITSFTSNGSLPPTLSFNSTSRRFTGTPTTAGNFTVLITATNQFGEGNGTITFNIAKGNSSISVTGNTTFLYTALPQGPDTATKSGSTGNITYSYLGVNGTTYAASATKPANVGNYTVTATLAGDSNYNSATSTSFAFAITPRPITITANSTSKTYGSTAPSGSLTTNFTLSNGTLAAGESISSLTLTYNGTPAGNATTAAVGNYSITPSALVIAGGGASASNYDITYVNGTLTVNRAPLTITAGNQTVPYGTPAGNVTAAGNYTASGFVNSENATILGGNANYSTSYTPTTPAGSAGVTISVGGLTATNYNITPLAGTVTVIKATPVISVSPTASAITFGQTLANSTLSGGNAGITGNFAFTSPATRPNTGTANHSVTFTPASTANFNTATTNVSVTVNKATPVITAPPTASPIVIGQSLSNSTLSGGVASVSGTFAFASPGEIPASIGTITRNVTFSPADSANYNTANVGVGVSVVPVPQINVSPPSLSGFSTKQNAASTNQTLTVNATNLLGAITVSAPAGYEISSNASVFSPSLSLTSNQGGNLTNTSLRVRLAANGTPGPASGNLTLSSQGATSRTVALSGTVIALQPPVIDSRTINGFIGSNLTASANATNSPTSYTANRTVPGLAFNATNGAFTGVPTTVGNFSVSVTATNIDGNGTGILTFSIAKGVPIISSKPTASDILNRRSLATSQLAGGNAINGNGETVPGVFEFAFPEKTPTAGTNSENATFTPTDQTSYEKVHLDVPVTVLATSSSPPTVMPATLNATVGQSFSYTVNATNSPYSFSASTPLPDGLRIHSHNGTIYGTPFLATSNWTTTISAKNRLESNGNVTSGTGNATIRFNIAKGTPQFKIPPVASPVLAGERIDAPQPSLTGGETDPPLEGVFAYTNPAQSFPTPGNYSVGVTFTPADSANWRSTTQNVTIQVNPRQPLGSLSMASDLASQPAGSDFLMEGNYSQTLSESEITITRTGPDDRSVVINLTESPAGSLLVDIAGNQTFSQLPGNVTISAGNNSVTLFVTAKNDAVHSGNRTIELKAFSELYGNATVNLRIVEDEPAPPPGSAGFASWSNNATRSAKNIRDYAIGGAAFGQRGESPLLDANPWTLSAIVRSGDPKLTVTGEWTNDLANPKWTPVDLTDHAVQAGVPTGFKRQFFIVPVPQGETRVFLRLKARLQE